MKPILANRFSIIIHTCFQDYFHLTLISVACMRFKILGAHLALHNNLSDNVFFFVVRRALDRVHGIICHRTTNVTRDHTSGHSLWRLKRVAMSELPAALCDDPIQQAGGTSIDRVSGNGDQLS